jgi:hypothetical protein
MSRVSCSIGLQFLSCEDEHEDEHVMNTSHPQRYDLLYFLNNFSYEKSLRDLGGQTYARLSYD